MFGRNTTIALIFEVKVNQLKRVALYVHEMGWRGQMGHGRQEANHNQMGKRKHALRHSNLQFT